MNNPNKKATARLERSYAAPAVQVQVELGRPADLVALGRAFARFRDDPLEQFRVRLKQQRAAQLRRLLGVGAVPSVSAERAHELSLPGLGLDDLCGLVGRPNPGIYDWDLSHYAMELALAGAEGLTVVDPMEARGLEPRHSIRSWLMRLVTTLPTNRVSRKAGGN